MRLTPGQKTPLSAIGAGTRLAIDVDYGLDGLDVVLFGLDAAKRIGDDRYTVLFSNTASPERAVVMRAGDRTATFDVDLAALPATIERLMIVASHDDVALSSARPLVVTVGDASFDAGASLGSERAVMLVELYRHAGEWRLSAIGQGFADGLAKLVTHLGGSVSDAAPPSTGGAAPPPPPPVPAASAPPPGPGVSLSKVTLEKKKAISLEKRGASFGDILLNLNWAQKRGLFGGSSMDLDLGCLYEMQDGRKGVIQALGHAFGDLGGPPFMELDGDDRSGSNTSGETIRINGRHFDRIRRIAVFALIYDGAVRWNQTDARISVRMPDQPEIVVEIRDGNDRQRLYGMAVIENDRGTMRITNHAVCYGDQKEFADDVGIFLNWSVGTKD